MAQMAATIQDYGAAERFLRGRQSRRIGHNTRVELRGSGCIAVKYHDSDIVKFVPGATILDSCGWRTSTTKDRISEFAPAGFSVYQRNHQWILWRHADSKEWPFADGIRIQDNGDITGAAEPADLIESAHLQRQISRYVRGYIRELSAGRIQPPGTGDCWYCSLFPDPPEAGTGTDHYRDHFRESYFVASLVVRAVERFPVSQAAMWWIQGRFNAAAGAEDPRVSDDFMRGIGAEQTSKSMKKYLRARFGIA